MNAYELIGFVAALLSIIAIIPSAKLGIIKRDFSQFPTNILVLQFASYFFWIVYGVRISSPSLVVANIVLFAVSGVILLLKMRAQ